MVSSATRKQERRAASQAIPLSGRASAVDHDLIDANAASPQASSPPRASHEPLRRIAHDFHGDGRMASLKRTAGHNKGLEKKRRLSTTMRERVHLVSSSGMRRNWEFKATAARHSLCNTELPLRGLSTSTAACAQFHRGSGEVCTRPRLEHTCAESMIGSQLVRAAVSSRWLRRLKTRCRVQMDYTVLQPLGLCSTAR